MPSHKTVSDAFVTFAALGLREGPTDAAQITARIEVWVRLMPDVTDEEFNLGVVTYLRDPVCSAFFPRAPGDLMRHLPTRQAAAADDSEDALTTVLAYYAAYGIEIVHDHHYPLLPWQVEQNGGKAIRAPAPPWKGTPRGERIEAALSPGLWTYGDLEGDIARRGWQRDFVARYKGLARMGAITAETQVVGAITGGASKRIEVRHG